MTQMELNLTASRAARDEGMAKVADNSGEFVTRALNALLSFQAGEKITGEDLRFRCEQRGIKPHSAFAWGAVVNIAIRRHYLIPTDQYTQMKDRTSHARATRVYVVA